MRIEALAVANHAVHLVRGCHLIKRAQSGCFIRTDLRLTHIRYRNGREYRDYAANSKDFTCSHPIHDGLKKEKFRLDADLNAARNIALSPPLIQSQTPSLPTPAIA